MPDNMKDLEAQLVKLEGNDQDTIKQVAAAVRAVGAVSVENYTEMQKSLILFQKTLDETRESGKADATALDKLNKQATDFAERFTAMNTEQQKRDARLAVLEANGARNLDGSESTSEKAEVERQHAIKCQKAWASHRGVEFDPAMDPKSVDIERYRRHREFFKQYAMYGDAAFSRLSADERKDVYAPSSDPSAGIFIPSEIDTEILRNITEMTPALSLFRVRVVNSDRYEQRTKFNSTGARWVGDTEAPANSGVVRFGNITIDLHELESMPEATNNQLQDWPELEQFIAEEAAEDFSVALGTATVTGNGVKKPRGILTYPDGNEPGKVLQVKSNINTGIDYDGVLNLMFGIKAAYYTAGSFLTSRAGVIAFMKVKDTDNRYIFSPSMYQGFQMSVAGKPIQIAEDMPAPTGAGVLFAGFGDWKKFYTVTMRNGMLFIRDHLTAKPNVQFLFRKRFGGDVSLYEAAALSITGA